MIYVLLADGFEEIEAIEPIDIMRRAGLMVMTVGIQTKNVCGAHGIKVEADITIADVNTADMEMLVLPGGAGHTLLNESEEVHSLIDFAVQNNIYIAAICASPSILGRRGLLKGKKATCFPGFEQYLTGAHIVGDKAVIDGNMITGKGAGAAGDFGFLIVKTLKDKKTATELKGVMQY